MMPLSHQYTQTFSSPLEATEARRLISNLTYFPTKRNGLDIRARMLHSPLRWTGTIHGDTFYLFKFVGPNLVLPRFGLDVRAKITEDANSSIVTVRARPNRWLGFAAIWWTAVAVAMLIIMLTSIYPTWASLGIFGFFSVIAVFQHASIARACQEELHFVTGLLRP